MQREREKTPANVINPATKTARVTIAAEEVLMVCTAEVPKAMPEVVVLLYTESRNIQPGFSLPMQFFRVVYMELTAALAGRHTAVHRWPSWYVYIFHTPESSGSVETIHFSTQSTRCIGVPTAYILPEI